MEAFCPCHVTGFFALRGEAHAISSEGCGIVLSLGASTEAGLGNGATYINGALSNAPTTAAAVELLTTQPMNIETSLPLPTSCGFGTSGAGALSTALAVNETLKLNYSFNALRNIAQRAEIACQTGVGDVVAQATGGVVMRLQGGTDRIVVPPVKISLVAFGKIPTAQIIQDKEIMRTINELGINALKSLNKTPTFNAFMTLSKEFACKSGLMSEKARDAIEAVEATGGSASMAMLGDAVFAIDPSGALDTFKNVMTATIYPCGAHVIGSAGRNLSSKVHNSRGENAVG